ncbi:hypothetical protein SLH46_20625 [Draconibacterium sp. IB214405]|uniref:hypothetical protein n=1 Tax=Draconibacterium sp. IB214405 TaxID=3097352 RepID=UPI002A0E31DF|nr:hypothetical protein [Draconibacterium sp. IB214405]MDX8341616.1 hypothetical protein [Draconibacterium sp. IB214405]
MTHQENMLDKYYRGETSLEEEKELKATVSESKTGGVEKDIFSFYEKEAFVPEGLEDDLFAGIEKQVVKKKSIRMRLYSAVSAAAVVLIVLTVFLDVRNKKQTKLEDQFFVMEQALFQMSESLQPEPEPDDMLVLWVDDDVEIIIN